MTGPVKRFLCVLVAALAIIFLFYAWQIRKTDARVRWWEAPHVTR